MLENVTGMVLSASPIGEYDKRVVLLTREYGKISAFAKGARKPNSPLLACSQPFTFGNFSLYHGRSSLSIHTAKVENYFEELRKDLEGVYYAYYFCEMADYFGVENLDGSGILKLLYQSFRALGTDSLHNELVRYIVELKMLVINGEAPRVSECVKCGSKERLHFFAVTEQGVFCDLCKNAFKGMVISEAALYSLQRIIFSDYKNLFTFTVSDSVRNELGEVMVAYTRDRIDKKFHSIEMIDVLAGNLGD